MFGVILLSMIGVNQVEAHTGHHHVHQRQVKNTRHNHRGQRPAPRHPGMKWVWVSGHWTRCHGHRHWIPGHWKLRRR